jgi:hypothetical protein
MGRYIAHIATNNDVPAVVVRNALRGAPELRKLRSDRTMPMPRTTHTRIETAIETVDREITYVADERQAFSRFTTRTRELSPEQTAPGTAVGGDTMAVSTGGQQLQSNGLRSVRDAYEETVMAVPHYEAVYGESLAESLAAEFRTAAATQRLDGQQLTPVLRETVIAAGERAMTEREEFGETLETERAALEEIRETLSEIESRAAVIGDSIGAATESAQLGQYDAELERLETDCEQLAAQRQRLLHRRSTGRLSGVDADSLVGFLYDDRAETCPALAEITDCLGTIRRQRERCLR